MLVTFEYTYLINMIDKEFQQFIRVILYKSLMENLTSMNNDQTPSNKTSLINNLTSSMSSHFQTQTSNKQDKLNEKKLAKHQEKINQSIHHILSNRTQDSILILKQLINQNCFQDKNQFQFLGFAQSWDSYHSNGPHYWFTSQYKKGSINGNVFDLLNLSFIIHLYSKRASFQEIINYYEKQIANNHQKKLQLYFGYANIYYSNHQYYKAEEIYLSILQFNDKCQKVYESLAFIKFQIFGQTELGLQYSLKCFEINPSNVCALYVFAICESQNRIQNLQKLAKKYPNYSRIYLALGYYEYQYQKQIEYYKKALICEQNYIQAQLNLMITYYVSGKQSPHSQKWYNNLMEKGKNHFLLYHFYGKMYQAKALEYYKKSLQLNPYHFQSFFQLGNIYLQSNNFGQAINYFHQYVKLNPYNSQVYHYLGFASQMLMQLLQAQTYYKKAIELDPKFDLCISNLSILYQKMNDYSESLKYFKLAHEVKPQNSQYCYNIAFCLCKLEKYSQSEEWIQKCIENGGDKNTKVYSFYGDLQYLKGNFYIFLQMYLYQISMTKSLKTEFFIEKLIKKLDHDTLLEILDFAFRKTKRSEEQSYSFMQIAELYLSIEQYDRAMESYMVLKTILSNEQYLSQEIELHLKKILRIPALGKYCQIQKYKVNKWKNNFDSLFRYCYQFLNLKIENV